MAKRFIDTGLFNDKWFMSLKKDSKLFWIYLITNCNHAGIIDINEPLLKLQTGLNSLITVIEELDNRLILLENGYYFIPKFLEYQYNKFPNSNVRAQKSAIDLLKRYNLWDEEKQTVIKGLVNSYVYGYGSDSDNKDNLNKFLEIIYFEKSKELDAAFKDYLKLRIKHKFTMNDRAINALVKKLRELSNGNVKEATKIIDNAILGKWKSFYSE